jgi:hypothetical protein
MTLWMCFLWPRHVQGEGINGSMPPIIPSYFQPSYLTSPMMLHTFCFPVATPALEIGLSAQPADLGIKPHIALEAKEHPFASFPDTAEVSAKAESAEDSENKHPAEPAQDPATFQKKGIFFSDWKGICNMEWPNIAKFDAWCQKVEITNSIKFCQLTIKWGRTSL